MLLIPKPEAKTQTTVLIVDDEDLNLFSLAAVLKTRNIKPVLAANTSETFVILERYPDIKAIIMDVMMPGMDGIETTRQIKNDERFAHIPVLVATAAHDITLKQQALEAGAHAYFTKPVDIDALLAALQEYTSTAQPQS